MKSRLFKIPKLNNHPISVQYDFSEKLYNKLHFHEEFQISYVRKGSGTMLCNSSSTTFKEQDLFLIGSMIPHVFIGDKNVQCETVSFYFNEKWLNQVFPGSTYFKHLINLGKHGIKMQNFTKTKSIDNTLNKGGLYRINSFLKLIEQISDSQIKKEKIHLKSSIDLIKTTDSEKINDVFEYIANNLFKDIRLDKLAEITSLTPPSFSRYFKQKTDKTVSTYIMELRIESACRLLQNEDLTVEEVGYKVGYNNLSNFLRQFKRIKSYTPKQYRIKTYSKLTH